MNKTLALLMQQIPRQIFYNGQPYDRILTDLNNGHVIITKTSDEQLTLSNQFKCYTDQIQRVGKEYLVFDNHSSLPLKALIWTTTKLAVRSVNRFSSFLPVLDDRSLFFRNERIELIPDSYESKRRYVINLTPFSKLKELYIDLTNSPSTSIDIQLPKFNDIFEYSSTFVTDSRVVIRLLDLDHKNRFYILSNHSSRPLLSDRNGIPFQMKTGIN